MLYVNIITIHLPSISLKRIPIIGQAFYLLMLERLPLVSSSHIA
jgi:hypothetical protein